MRVFIWAKINKELFQDHYMEFYNLVLLDILFNHKDWKDFCEKFKLNPDKNLYKSEDILKVIDNLDFEKEIKEKIIWCLKNVDLIFAKENVVKDIDIEKYVLLRPFLMTILDTIMNNYEETRKLYNDWFEDVYQKIFK